MSRLLAVHVLCPASARKHDYVSRFRVLYEQESVCMFLIHTRVLDADVGCYSFFGRGTQLVLASR